MKRTLYSDLMISIVANRTLAVTGETVSVPAGAAGTIKDFYIARKPILDSHGAWFAGLGDTSLTFTSATFDTEVAPFTEDADLTNGDYWIDPLTGHGRGKKADTGTSLTVSYSIAQYTGDLSAGGTITGDLDVTGNFSVSGSFSVGSLVSDGIIIDATNAEAFLVRKNGDTGDVLAIDTVDSQVKLANGTSLLPSYSFINDPDTGFYRKGANDIGFVANAAEIGDWTTGILTLASGHIRYSAGTAVGATTYSVGRDADATNQLHFNVPTGASFEWSVNDVAEMTLSATAVDFQNNSITTTGGGSLTGTWSNLGTVTTIDINGGTLDGTVIGGASAAAASFTTVSQSNLTTWSAGNAFTAGSYQIGRDASATNVLGFNVPTGSGHLFNVQGTPEFGINAAGAFAMSGNSIKVYNTADIVTNTESVTIDYFSNIGRIYSYPTGSGTVRSLQISAFNAAAAGTTISLNPSVTTPYFSVTSITSTTTGIHHSHACTIANTSSTSTGFLFTAALNQSSTAGVDVFKINTNISTLGSGTKNLLLIQNSSADVFAFGMGGNFTHTQGANPSSSTAPVAYTLTAGLHTNGIASTEWNDIKINLAAVKTWNTGALTNQRDIVYNARTYAAIASSTISNGVSMSFNGGPLAGTNVSLTSSGTMEFRTWLSNASASTKQISIFMPGLANGVGSTQSLVGLIVDAEGSNPVNLSNQTATTDAVAGLGVIPITYTSTTNTRTITLATGAVFHAPIAGSNVTFTSVHGLTVASGSFGVMAGRILGAAGSNVASTNDMTLGLGTQFTITGTTQVNRIATAAWSAGSFFILKFADVVTVKHNQASGGGFGTIMIDGAADLVTTANQVVVGLYDGTNFVLKPWN